MKKIKKTKTKAKITNQTTNICPFKVGDKILYRPSWWKDKDSANCAVEAFARENSYNDYYGEVKSINQDQITIHWLDTPSSCNDHEDFYHHYILQEVVLQRVEKLRQTYNDIDQDIENMFEMAANLLQEAGHKLKQLEIDPYNFDQALHPLMQGIRSIGWSSSTLSCS